MSLREPIFSSSVGYWLAWEWAVELCIFVLIVAHGQVIKKCCHIMVQLNMCSVIPKSCICCSTQFSNCIAIITFDFLCCYPNTIRRSYLFISCYETSLCSIGVGCSTSNALFNVEVGMINQISHFMSHVDCFRVRYLYFLSFHVVGDGWVE
jgi:hypothetical protein